MAEPRAIREWGRAPLAMTARELTVFAYALATEGRTGTELAELEEWLTTDPAALAERERARRLEAITFMGGAVHHSTETQEGGET